MRRMLSINETIKTINVTEEMYVYHEDEEWGEYLINFKDANSPQKYLIDAGGVEDPESDVTLTFNDPIIVLSTAGADYIDGAVWGYGEGYWSVSLLSGNSFSVSIMNGVVVIGPAEYEL